MQSFDVPTQGLFSVRRIVAARALVGPYTRVSPFVLQQVTTVHGTVFAGYAIAGNKVTLERSLFRVFCTFVAINTDLKAGRIITDTTLERLFARMCPHVRGHVFLS